MVALVASIVLGFQSDKGPETDFSTFAAKMSVLAGTPAIVIGGEGETIPWSALSKDTDELLARPKKAGFNSLRQSIATTFRTGIPKSKWGLLAKFLPKTSSMSASKRVEIDKQSLKDGVFTFATKPGEVVSIKSIADFKWTRPLLMSPYFYGDGQDGSVMGIAAKNVDESDFLKALARGVGAIYLPTSKQIEFKFDPSVFRSDASKLIEQAKRGSAEPSGGEQTNYSYDPENDMNAQRGQLKPNTPASVKAGLTFVGEVISTLPDSFIVQCFEFSKSNASINLNNFPSLKQSTVTFLQTLSTGAENTSGQKVKEILRRVSRRSPGKITINSNFQATIELNLTIPGGNTSQYDTVSIQSL
jgi:hypothetical protein